MTLDIFKKWSGLRPCHSKSSMFSKVLDDEKERILQELNFEERAQPFKYLEMPINSSRPLVETFFSLIDKIMGKITSWTNGFLSYVERLLLTCLICFHTMFV